MLPSYLGDWRRRSVWLNRVLAALIAFSPQMAGCACPHPSSSSSGCGGGGSISCGLSSGGGGCGGSTPGPCYGPYCDAGPPRDFGVPGDAGPDLGPASACPMSPCNVLDRSSCPTGSACRLVFPHDGGVPDAFADDAPDFDAAVDDADVDAPVDDADIDAPIDDAAIADADVDAPIDDAAIADADVDAPTDDAAIDGGLDAGPTLLWCDAYGSGRSDAPCASDAECAAGFVCLELTGGARCRALCCGGAGCPYGESCRYELVPGVGLCAAPMECDPVAQTGCYAGFICNYWGPGQTGCDPVGPQPELGDCTTRADCAPGLYCGPALASVCRQYCEPTNPSTCPSHRCEPIDVGIGYCLPSPFGVCDPLTQIGCPTTAAGCYPDGLSRTMCRVAGTIPDGFRCDDLAACQPGSVCASALGPRTCAPTCDRATGAPCGGATHCTAISGFPPGLGACQ